VAELFNQSFGNGVSQNGLVKVDRIIFRTPSVSEERVGIKTKTVEKIFLKVYPGSILLELALALVTKQSSSPPRVES
jgi:hypothetical protein